MVSVAVLTRPSGKNEALADRLHERGWRTLALPALRIKPLPAPRQGPPLPQGFDLAVFVSGNAARLYAGQLAQAGRVLAWPASTVAATVGPASARTLSETMALEAGRAVLYPPADAPRHDSEALWERIVALPSLPRRVLLVRGTQGRDWLADKLRAAGAQVTCYAVYERQPAVWDPSAWEQLTSWATNRIAVSWLLTSGEGIDVVRARLTEAGLTDWWRRCSIVVTHPGLVARLGIATGDVPAAMVKTCLPHDGAILEAIVSP